MAYELYQSRYKGFEIDAQLDKVTENATKINALSTSYDANKVMMPDNTTLPSYLANNTFNIDVSEYPGQILEKKGDGYYVPETDLSDYDTSTEVDTKIAAAAYTLPPATDTTLGGVKPDGTTITVDSDGTLHGASAIDNLDDIGDVNVTGATDGQALIYDATNDEWIPGEASGGTTVIANPTLVGTEDSLEGLQVGDDKFKVNTNIINSGVHIHTTDAEDIESHLASEVHLDQTQDTPVGTIVPFFGTTAPAHYLACDGSVYNISAYPDLAEFIKNEFGSYNYFGGDGTTTFGVPDLRGEFLRGTGANSHTNMGSGANVGTHQDGTYMPIIGAKEDCLLWLNTGDPNDDNTVWTRNQDSFFNLSPKTNKGKFTNKNGTWDDPGVNTMITLRPTNTSVLYCIKAEATYYLVNQIENATIAALDKYSTDEKCIGCWIDGKPIYQKVVTTTAMPNKNVVTVPHRAANVDKIIGIGGLFKQLTSVAENTWTSLPRVQDNQTNQDVAVDVNRNNIYLKSRGFDMTNVFEEAIIILKYTKTIDAPNSFSIDMLSNVQDLVLTAAEVQETIDSIVV